MDANVTRLSDIPARKDPSRARRRQTRRAAAVEIERFDHWDGAPTAMAFPTMAFPTIADLPTEARAA